MRPPEETAHASTVVDHIKSGGFTAALIGMAGMVARLLLSNEPGMTWGKAARHVLAAGIVAWLADQALSEIAMAKGLKTACIGVSGATATHIVDFAIEWVKAKKGQEIAKIKRGSNNGKKRK